MLRKISTLFVAVAMLSTLVFAQNRAILTPDNQLIPVNGDVREAIDGAKLIPHNGRAVKNVIVTGNKTNSSKGTIDTLSVFEELGLSRNVNFGFFSQDVMIQWYVAPADLYIKAVAFTVSDAGGFDAGYKVNVMIVGTDLTASEVAGLLQGGEATYVGYYPSDTYMTSRAPFPWWGNGDWVAGTEGVPEVWKYDLWSDFGDGYPTTGVASTDSVVYNWVVLNDALGFEPDMIQRGQVFGIAIQHNGTDPAQPDGERIGFLSNKVGAPHCGYKYYAAGRLDPPNDAGWWTRKYTWDFVAEVDLVGDRPPVIMDVPQLVTTLSTDPREVTATVTDDNPSGGNAGVASVELQYSTDDMTTWNSIAMTANGDVYSAEIPGQSPGTHVYYKVVATDVEGNTAENGPYDYYIYAPYNYNLVLYNGYPQSDDFLMAYYFNGDTLGYVDNMDLWCYGVAEATLFSPHYKNIYEITSKGPVAIYNDDIAAWLASASDNNYALYGDEWLGYQSNWTNGPHGPGEFHYDVLGITYEYNDVNFNANGDQTNPYPLTAVEGSLLGGEVAASVANYGDQLIYNPYAIYGISNWLDAVDFETDVEVDYTTVPVGATDSKPVAGHRTLAAGNKIVFMAFDPLYLTSDSVWYGVTPMSPLIQTCNWFGVPVSVDDEVIPTEFELSQNYPNPFNPTTVIKYTLPKEANVTLKVYNLVGQEVATLVNANQAQGIYEVTFDASNLSSGVYFYTLNAGNFSVTKKMMLLK